MAGTGKLLPLLVKLPAAVGALLLAAASFQFSQTAYLRANNPAQAFAVNPQDAKALANELARRLNDDPSFEPNAKDLADIREALRSCPLEPNLLAFEALHQESQGQSQAAAATMGVADQITRRNALVQLWLIERSVASEDVKSAIRHYHAALSVHPELHKTLLPILSSATAYPEIRSALRPYLMAQANWSNAFLSVATREAAAADIAALLQPLPLGLATDANRIALANLLRRLIIEADPQAANSFARALIPDFVASILTDAAVRPETLDPRLGSLAWAFPAPDGIEVQVGSDNDITAVIQPLSRGTFAVRELVVEEGTHYTLQTRVAVSSEATNVRLNWSASCLGAGEQRQFWDQMTPPIKTATTYQMSFEVPESCRLIQLKGATSGADGQLPYEITLGAIKLDKSKY